MSLPPELLLRTLYSRDIQKKLADSRLSPTELCSTYVCTVCKKVIADHTGIYDVVRCPANCGTLYCSREVSLLPKTIHSLCRQPLSLKRGSESVSRCGDQLLTRESMCSAVKPTHSFIINYVTPGALSRTVPTLWLVAALCSRVRLNYKQASTR